MTSPQHTIRKRDYTAMRPDTLANITVKSYLSAVLQVLLRMAAVHRYYHNHPDEIA